MREVKARRLKEGKYPWKAPYERFTRIDSTAIFIVGPVSGCRKIYDASVLDIRGGGDEELPASWKLLEQVVTNEDGVEEQRPVPVTEFNLIGSGYHLTCYRPTYDPRRRKCVVWSCSPAIDRNSSAVAEVIRAAQNDRDMFPTPQGDNNVDTTIGEASFSWSQMPLTSQKLVSTKKFDPTLTFFRRGAHMPLMLFVGDSTSTRRTPQSRRRREQKAEQRGWGREAREAKGKGKKGRGKGMEASGQIMVGDFNTALYPRGRGRGAGGRKGGGPTTITQYDQDQYDEAVLYWGTDEDFRMVWGGKGWSCDQNPLSSVGWQGTEEDFGLMYPETNMPNPPRYHDAYPHGGGASSSTTGGWWGRRGGWGSH